MKYFKQLVVLILFVTIIITNKGIDSTNTYLSTKENITINQQLYSNEGDIGSPKSTTKQG